MPNYPFITFEGPIAAGKTTIAGMLANHLRSALLREDFEGNEFLADFYSDRERWALAMQLWFLSSRHSQLRSVVAPLTRPLVADYSYLKDGIYARFLLQDRELRLYNYLATNLPRDVVRPDLVVYLDAKDDVLMERIRRRQRPYENVIDNRYLDNLRVAYEKELAAVAGLKVLRHDTSNLDLFSEAQMNDLFEKIMAAAP
jgi:deoxyadenosine/deoxycytidine kinase